MNFCSLGNKQGVQALFPAIKEVISFYKALRRKGTSLKKKERVCESASRPSCGFWRIDDQQLEI
jgi:hypothetical protein